MRAGSRANTSSHKPASNGGSTKARSNTPACSPRSHAKASPACTSSWPPASRRSPNCLRFRASRGSASTICTDAAPRDNASSPSAPLPANRSTTCAPGNCGCSQLKRVSRTRSVVGRRPGRSGTGRRVPRQRPPMMRILPGKSDCARACRGVRGGDFRPEFIRVRGGRVLPCAPFSPIPPTPSRTAPTTAYHGQLVPPQ